MKRSIPIGDIKIPAAFRKFRPRAEKLDAKKSAYAANGSFGPLPIVDQDLNLIDGYACYVAARDLGHAELLCEVKDNPMTKVVTARHEGCDKDYKWALSSRHAAAGYITVGTDVAVLTRFGRKKATVTGITEMPAVEAKALRSVLGKWHEDDKHAAEAADQKKEN